MNNTLAFVEEHFVPVAAKISSNRHLIAIRDAFIATMPITMAGSTAVLLNVFLRDFPTTWGWEGFVNAMAPVIGVNGVIWFGSIAIMSLAFVISLGYNVAESYDVNPIAGALVAFSSYMVLLPQSAIFTTEIEGVPQEVSQWGFININYLGATGLFTALIIGYLTSVIYCKLMIRKIIIKLPDDVPPAVNKAFAAIIPGVVAIYVAGIISYAVTTLTGQPLNDLISTYIQAPLLNLSQGLFTVILLTFLIQLFWFFGMHGHNVLAPVLNGMYDIPLIANIDHMAAGGDVSGLPYMWTRGSFDAYIQMGGSGVTIALIIAILIFSKREEHRTVAKLGAPMGLFNINEPIMFGMPVVLNPIFLIPFIIAPVVSAIIGYVATVSGLIPPVYISVPWVMPPGLYAFFATGGNIIAALVALFNVFISFIIYVPFVIIANKVREEQQ